jgi:hypothetical protein
MGTPGYLYVLVNPSMEGLVKVGRTARDPKDRVNELSSATGVPTSFLLVYQRFFNEIERAEQLVHELLEDKGYRISSNREFFNAPPHEVIETIIQVEDIAIKNTCNNLSSSLAEEDEKDLITSSQSDDFLDTLELNSGNPGKELMDLGDEYYYGLGETLQDYSEALRLYKQAARMGAIEAYLQIGEMYFLGRGCTKDLNKALDFWKDGVNKGDNKCYAEMAQLYVSNKQYDNAIKCWKRFFNSGWIGKNSYETGRYYYIYLSNIFLLNLKLDHFEELARNKKVIREAIERMMEISAERNDLGMLKIQHEMLDFINRLGKNGMERVPSFLERVVRFFKFNT